MITRSQQSPPLASHSYSSSSCGCTTMGSVNSFRQRLSLPNTLYTNLGRRHTVGEVPSNGGCKSERLLLQAQLAPNPGKGICQARTYVTSFPKGPTKRMSSRRQRRRGPEERNNYRPDYHGFEDPLLSKTALRHSAAPSVGDETLGKVVAAALSYSYVAVRQ
ncbi:hypothetical protein EDB83DRAFT_206067 [Lactarius deliciosus]|nr:hypothetical protein EDB83DRAFT_206067 [Lactarius deliciosus]